MKELTKVKVLISIKEKNSGNLQSVKCMICNYYYFKDIGFKYQPYVCNGCHDFSMTVQNLSDFFVVIIKNVDYRVYITGVDKKAAVFILKNSDLSDKGVL